MMVNSKQLTLFECCSRGTANNRQNRTRNEQARSDTTISSSSSTTIISDADSYSLTFRCALMIPVRTVCSYQHNIMIVKDL